MRGILAAILLAAPALAAKPGVQYGTPLNGAGQAITPASVSASTVSATGAGDRCLAAGTTFYVDCNAGNVVVGGSQGLRVSGQETITSSLTVQGAGGILGTYGLKVGSITIPTGGAGNYLTVATSSLVVTSAGNVGIGTASPATLLHMSSGTLTIDGTGANIVTPTLTVSPGVSTITPSGFLFFIDSTTVTGSTHTIGSGTNVIFSTYTLAGNTLTKPGQQISVTCALRSGSVSLTTPGADINSAGIPEIAQLQGGNFTTANAVTWITGTATYMRPGNSLIDMTAHSQSAGGNGITAPTVSDGANGLSGGSTDWTASHVFSCSAHESGGQLNFLWMKVELK